MYIGPTTGILSQGEMDICCTIVASDLPVPPREALFQFIDEYPSELGRRFMFGARYDFSETDVEAEISAMISWLEELHLRNPYAQSQLQIWSRVGNEVCGSECWFDPLLIRRISDVGASLHVSTYCV